MSKKKPTMTEYLDNMTPRKREELAAAVRVLWRTRSVHGGLTIMANQGYFISHAMPRDWRSNEFEEFELLGHEFHNQVFQFLADALGVELDDEEDAG